MGSRCTVNRVTDAAAWEALFSRVEHPHMVQTWAYGEARQAAGGGWDTRRHVLDAGGWRPRRLVFERGGEPVAICQLLDKSLAGLRWASRLNRGPLFLDAAPGDDVVRDVYVPSGAAASAAAGSSSWRRRWRPAPRTGAC